MHQKKVLASEKQRESEEAARPAKSDELIAQVTYSGVLK